MKKTSLILLLFTWTMQAAAQYKNLEQLKKGIRQTSSTGHFPGEPP